MDPKHLNDLLEITEEQNIKTGDLVSEYTALAIQYSNNGYTPTTANYNQAHEEMIKKYRGTNNDS